MPIITAKHHFETLYGLLSPRIRIVSVPGRTFYIVTAKHYFETFYVFFFITADSHRFDSRPYILRPFLYYIAFEDMLQ